jgi:S-adenosylmethionine hydrolase
MFAPVVENNVIKGIVIYVDNYQNVITNITKAKFREVGMNRKFIISFRGEEIHQVRDSYSDVPVGEILALFGCNGHLEIAMNNGTAGSLLGLHPDDPVRIEFLD